MIPSGMGSMHGYANQQLQNMGGANGHTSLSRISPRGELGGAGLAANMHGGTQQHTLSNQQWVAQQEAIYQKQQQVQQAPQQATVRKFVPFQDSAHVNATANDVLQKLMKKYVHEASPNYHRGGSQQQGVALPRPNTYDVAGVQQREIAHTQQNRGQQPHITTKSALSPRTNGRPASAPNYPRDDSDVPEPRYVPAEEYQLQIHQTAAFAMNSGDWQNLMVNGDGSYQKHEPWSSAWIKSRGYIRAWLEFQAQADEDLRGVKEMPGVRQHTHHNEVAITQHKNVPDRPKMRRGRCLRWADEDDLPDRAKKPTTPRDPRAFVDRRNPNDLPNSVMTNASGYEVPALEQQKTTAQFSMSTYPSPHMSAVGARKESDLRLEGSSAQQPDYRAGTDASGAAGIYGVTKYEMGGHASAQPSDVARPSSHDLAPLIEMHSRSHYHRLSRSWGERQVSEHTSQNLRKARLDLSVLNKANTMGGTHSDDTSDLNSALRQWSLGHVRDSRVSSDAFTHSRDSSRFLGGGGHGRDSREASSAVPVPRTVLHF